MLNETETIRTMRFDRDLSVDRDAQTTTRNWFTNQNGTFKAGFWASQPGRIPLDYKKAELCVLLDGVVKLIDESGHIETYHGGDTFLIPEGFKGVWETVETARKFFAVSYGANGQ